MTQPETVPEKVARTRRAQGLPRYIEDASFYDKLAAGVIASEMASDEADHPKAA